MPKVAIIRNICVYLQADKHTGKTHEYAKVKIGENGNGKQKNGGGKAAKREEGGKSDKC